MANLAAPTSIESNFIQYGIFAVNTVTGGGAYLHMETNIGTPSSYEMYLIEAVGYSYAVAKPIRCAWFGYTYLYNISGVENTSYNGIEAVAAYDGGAGYLVLRAYLAGQHYNCFTLNAYMVAGNGYQQVVSIRRSSQNSTSGAYY
jgi:hypothetical protein